MLMAHLLAVLVHAVTGSIALAAGALVLYNGRLFGLYRWTMLIMAGALAVAVAIGWSFYPIPAGTLFSALLALAVLMVVRCELAARLRRSGRSDGPFVEHVGFTLISLSVGFIVVTLFNAGLPAWIGIGAGLVVILVGRRIVTLLADRASEPDPALGHAVRTAR